MTLYCAYQQATTYPAAADRKLMQVGMILASKSGTVRGGVIPQGDVDSLKVTAQSTLTLSITAGSAIVTPDYRVFSDSTATVTVDAGGASARTDLVILRVYETESGDASSKAQFEVVKGTTQTDPSVPARSLVLAAIAVAAGAATITSANVTDRRVYTTSAGGVLTMNPASGVGLLPGQTIYDPSVDRVYVRMSDGTIAPFNTPRSIIAVPPAGHMQPVSGYSPKLRLEGGRCYMEGALGTLSGDIPNSPGVCTLPVGYRPANIANALFFISYLSPGTYCRVKIYGTGSVFVDSLTGTGAKNQVWFDGISFAVE